MQPDITIRFTTHEHIAACERLRRESAHQLTQATTASDRRYWQHQIDRAEMGILRWQAQIDKEGR